jgi:hypothetical protein
MLLLGVLIWRILSVILELFAGKSLFLVLTTIIFSSLLLV